MTVVKQTQFTAAQAYDAVFGCCSKCRRAFFFVLVMPPPFANFDAHLTIWKQAAVRHNPRLYISKNISRAQDVPWIVSLVWALHLSQLLWDTGALLLPSASAFLHHPCPKQVLYRNIYFCRASNLCCRNATWVSALRKRPSTLCSYRVSSSRVTKMITYYAV